MMTPGRTLMTLAAAMLAGGCAHASSTRGDVGLEETAVEDGRTRIRVTNNNWSDMTIYLVRSGSQQRLGTVTSQTTHTFTIAAHLLTSSRVHLMADPIGSSKLVRSAPLLLAAGQTAEWQLENSHGLSSMWVR